MTLPYSVDEGLGVCQVIDPFIAHTVKSLDVQHDPVAGCGKCIDLVFHVAGYNPGFTSIEKHCHTGGVEKLNFGGDGD